MHWGDYNKGVWVLISNLTIQNFLCTNTLRILEDFLGSWRFGSAVTFVKWDLVEIFNVSFSVPVGVHKGLFSFYPFPRWSLCCYSYWKSVMLKEFFIKKKNQ